MKYAWLSVFVGWSIALAAVAGGETTYHVSAFIFDTEEMYKPAGECEGNADVCKDLFTPPFTYDGRHFSIPKQATVFGVVSVTDGKTCKIIPLFTWSDEAGKTRCACNGPTPWFARGEETPDKLLKSILDALKKP